jgi:hypothetical protein
VYNRHGNEDSDVVEGLHLCQARGLMFSKRVEIIFFIDTFVPLAIPSLQLRLTTSLFSNLDSTLKTNTQYLSIVQCRVLPICSHILLCSCLAQIPLTLYSAFALKMLHYDGLNLVEFFERSTW